MNALAYALRQELPADEAARDGLFGELLRPQFCFSETCGFTFGVDPETSFAILQALIDVRRMESGAWRSPISRPRRRSTTIRRNCRSSTNTTNRNRLAAATAPWTADMC